MDCICILPYKFILYDNWYRERVQEGERERLKERECGGGGMERETESEEDVCIAQNKTFFVCLYKLYDLFIL